MKKNMKIILVVSIAGMAIFLLSVVLFLWYNWWFPVPNHIWENKESYIKLYNIVPMNTSYSYKSCSLDSEICKTMKNLRIEKMGKSFDEAYFVEQESWWSNVRRVYLYRINWWGWYTPAIDSINFEIIDKNWATYTEKPFL